MTIIMMNQEHKSTQAITDLSAAEIDIAFDRVMQFLWNRHEWDMQYKWLGTEGYTRACDNAIADIRAFELRGMVFEPPTDREHFERFRNIFSDVDE